jgi:hypothetical protein
MNRHHCSCIESGDEEMNALSKPPRFMDNQAAAKYLNLSPRTLEKFRVYGGGPVYRKFGRRVLYAIEDLEAYAKSQSRTSTSEDPEPS